MIRTALDWINQPSKTKRILRETLDSEQRNVPVLNVHRINTENVGDHYCAPYHYFPELENQPVIDILDCKSLDSEVSSKFVSSIANHSLIIGGGGLLNRDTFETQMRLFEQLTSRGKKTVLWGVGHNGKNPTNSISTYNINTDKFGLVGTRDQSMPGDYVPCVSCMNPIFDRNFKTINEIGVVFHERTLKNKKITKAYQHLPSSSNNAPFEELVSFIGATETIVTDSYHVMYWSMLLGKRIAVIPNSSKFFDFQYKPLFTSFDKSLMAAKNAPSFTGVLEECRALNRHFSNKVFDYLGL